MAKTLEFPDDVRPDFQGFSEAAFKFLVGLEENNGPDLVQGTQGRYMTRNSSSPWSVFSPNLPRTGHPRDFLSWATRHEACFESIGDIRFSKDKNPYKTHVGAVLSRSGEKGNPGIVYVHFQPGNSFIAAGFYSPGKELLQAWRVRMADKPGEFLQMADPILQPDARFPLEHRGALKTLPRGFKEHAESTVADYLKWKHFSGPAQSRRP